MDRVGLEPTKTMSTNLQSAAIAAMRPVHKVTYKYIYLPNDLSGNRTRVSAVKGRRLNRLTMRPRRARFPIEPVNIYTKREKRQNARESINSCKYFAPVSIRILRIIAASAELACKAYFALYG